MKVSRNLFYSLIVLSIIMIFFVIVRLHAAARNGGAAAHEGFSQGAQFVLKRNNKIYDDFYSEIYDSLYDTKKMSKYVVNSIISVTKPTLKHSTFLDVGSGTGETVSELGARGFQATGIDKSAAMVKIAQEKVGAGAKIQKGNALNPINFEHASFSHVLLLHETIYEFDDKKALIRVLRGWLKRNGFLIIHLVSRRKYTAEAAAAPQTLQFWGVNYSREIGGGGDAAAGSGAIIVRETFTDNQTKKIRQHEKTMYMEHLLNLVDDIKKEGFLVHGIIEMQPVTEDTYQYLYIFEKI
jgi:SAM-dependent methyltransferase